jgi:Ca2+-binding RTX toxin-like protein
LVTATALAATSLLAAPAVHAATVTSYIDEETESGDSVTFQGEPGERNMVTVTLDASGKQYVFRDRANPVSLGSDNGVCKKVDAHAAKCAATATFMLMVDLGDGNDELQMLKYPRANRPDEALTLSGGEGDDTILGGSLGEEIDGGPGNDVLRGNGGGDLIFGGSGADKLYGGKGRDLLTGNAGNDLLVAWDGGVPDTLVGSAGTDRAQADRVDKIKLCEHVQRSTR